MNAAELAALRDELPHCDLGYVRRVAPGALRVARRYNAARAAADPDNVASLERARRAKRRLMAAVA